MLKTLTILGMIVALCVLLIFGLDLAAGIPFDKVTPAMNIGFLVCAAILAYLSWSTFRQLR